jgi:DNA-binding LacI/PurR family transcriptional regulator
MKKSISLKDIAKKLNVSAAVVSVVLNNKEKSSIRVGMETRKAIINTAKSMGYVPNLAAKSLAGGKNNILGLFTYESVFPFEFRNFYYPFLLGIEKEAEKQGYDLLFMTSTGVNDGQREIYKNGINRLKLADGAILIGLRKNEKEISRLVKEGFPFVFIGYREFQGLEISYVTADYMKVTSDMVKYIAAKGHKNIVLLRTIEDTEPSHSRELGFRQAFKDLGFTVNPDKIIKISAETITGDFLQMQIKSGVSAIIAERYDLGYKLINICGESGLKIPDDISIAVLGGPKPENLPEIDWTTFAIPGEEMGFNSVRILIELLENENHAPIQLTLKCKISRGSTVGKVKRS